MARSFSASIGTLGFLASLLLTQGAEAGFNMRRLPGDLPHPASQMREGEAQITPIAYVRFCLHNSDQCAKTEHADRVDLSLETWKMIREVNAEVNDRIRPDPQKGAFDWSVSATVGNCNDYAVQKRKELIEKGLPSSALSLSVVVTPWGEGHLVLTVRTDRGDFVLDNLRQAILSWDRSGYEFNRVQSLDDPATWVRPERAHRERGHREPDARTAQHEASTTDL